MNPEPEGRAVERKEKGNHPITAVTSRVDQLPGPLSPNLSRTKRNPHGQTAIDCVTKNGQGEGRDKKKLTRGTQLHRDNNRSASDASEEVDSENEEEAEEDELIPSDLDLENEVS